MSSAPKFLKSQDWKHQIEGYIYIYVYIPTASNTYIFLVEHEKPVFVEGFCQKPCNFRKNRFSFF